MRDLQDCFPEEVDVDLKSERREVDIPGRNANALWWERACYVLLALGMSIVAGMWRTGVTEVPGGGMGDAGWIPIVGSLVLI